MSKVISNVVLVILVFSLLFLPAVSADCSPYKIYSVDSISIIDGWLLLGIGENTYTCEMIAGEWTPVMIGVPSEYYILTDGDKAVFLGGIDIGRETFPGFVNGTLYVLTVKRTHVPYKNVTITIEGVPHNFTLLKNVTVKALYRFNGACFENVSTCRIVSYPNGTKINTCNMFIWNVSDYKIPGGSLTGVPVRIENGTVHFRLGGSYSLVLPGGVNASVLKLEAFKAEHGLVLVNRGAIKVPAGEGVEDIPVLFVADNKTVRSPKFVDLEKFVCAKGGANTTSSTANSVVENMSKKSICGPGFVALLAVLGLLTVRILRGW
ncbi:hypothetical protein [Thermococcus sp. 21S9]|uniref:hypothetical protein n=1 Tax=Thermococcus sp. 21S9 TaxID=1638223 RepID=UPI0014398D60|nr:hypothetical protein [Thermococcus sp. 21S9]NJE54420.1 hypothetical protein [Thermococcus sp. 21S9]